MVRKAVTRLIVAAVAVPVAKQVLRRVGQSMQQRQPNSRVGNTMQRAAEGLPSFGRSR